MKYCNKCKKIYSNKEEKCTECSKQLKEITEINTPVYLITACGFDRSRIEGVLKDNNIIYTELPEKDETGAASLVGSYTENYRILVPYQAYLKAKEVLSDIGIDVEDGLDDEELQKSISDIKSKSPVPEINRGVSTALMIICLLLVAGAVLLTDAVIAWIQSLF